MQIEIVVYYCSEADGVCLMHQAILNLPLVVSADLKPPTYHSISYVIDKTD